MVMHGPDHALRSQFRVGQRVYFGRSRGEQTLGEIIKINPRKCKVKQLESRGTLKNHRVGTIWTVPFSLLRDAGEARADAITDAFASVGRKPVGPPVDNGDGTTTTTFAPKELTYNPFAGEDNNILLALLECYGSLSPENLSCDGEASAAHVRQRGGELRRKVKYLQLALGYEVDEVALYAWAGERRKFLDEQAKRKAASS